MAAGEHSARGAVEAGRFVADQPCAGKSREPTEIDMAFLERVIPGNVTRQHARIRRLDAARDERHTHPRRGSHAEALQHMDMRMPATDEHQVLFCDPTLLHRRHYARAPPRRRDPMAAAVEPDWLIGQRRNDEMPTSATGPEGPTLEH